MSMETHLKRTLNRLQKQSKTLQTFSTPAARQVYIYMRDVLGMCVQPSTDSHHRLVNDNFAITFTPKQNSTSILFRNITL